MEFENKEWKQVMAIVPVYGENGGNFSEVWLDDGRHLIAPYRVETVVEQLARIFAVDTARLRLNCKKMCGRVRLMPLPLDRDLWLTPLYMREEVRGKEDGKLGYVVFQKLAACQPMAENRKKSEIIFKNQERLCINQQSQTANQLILLTQTLGRYMSTR